MELMSHGCRPSGQVGSSRSVRWFLSSFVTGFRALFSFFSSVVAGYLCFKGVEALFTDCCINGFSLCVYVWEGWKVNDELF